MNIELHREGIDVRWGEGVQKQFVQDFVLELV